MSVTLYGFPFNGNFKRVHTYADGSCFFHALSIATNFKECASSVDMSHSERRRIGHELRKMMFTRRRWEEFTKTIDPEIRTMVPTLDEIRDTRAYVGDFVWRHCSKLLEVNILIVESPDRVFMTPDIPSERYPRTIVLAYIDKNHFEAIVPVNEIPGVVDQDDPMIQHLLARK